MNYIDLGLSVLWADCNIGAEKPENYGDYFDWDEWDSGIQVPTREQIRELIDNCTWEWATVNGINGYEVTSNINGNSIFLPAAGYRYGTSLNYAGSYGSYWGSTLNSSYSYHAYGLYFYSCYHSVYYYSRYHGRSVRPVKEKKG